MTQKFVRWFFSSVPICFHHMPLMQSIVHTGFILQLKWIQCDIDLLIEEHKIFSDKIDLIANENSECFDQGKLQELKNRAQKYDEAKRALENNAIKIHE